VLVLQAVAQACILRVKDGDGVPGLADPVCSFASAAP